MTLTRCGDFEGGGFAVLWRCTLTLIQLVWGMSGLGFVVRLGMVTRDVVAAASPSGEARRFVRVANTHDDDAADDDDDDDDDD